MINSNAILSSIRSDNALSTILSRFESSYIIDMVKDSLNMKFRPYETAMPSLHSIESNFNAVLNNVDDTHKETVLEVREKTYKEIINEVCLYYEIQYIENTNVNTYSAAYTIYDFFVSNFTNYYFDFFVRYIIANKSYLYEYLNLSNFKKDKGSSTIYSRKITNDTELAMIHANLATVLDSVMLFDISLQDIITMSSLDEQVKLFLINHLVDVNGNIFKTKYASIYMAYRTDVITNIKLALQDIMVSGNGNIPIDITRQVPTT